VITDLRSASTLPLAACAFARGAPSDLRLEVPRKWGVRDDQGRVRPGLARGGARRPQPGAAPPAAQRRQVLETLLSIRRAGADFIFTYYARQVRPSPPRKVHELEATLPPGGPVAERGAGEDRRRAVRRLSARRSAPRGAGRAGRDRLLVHTLSYA